MLIGYSASRPAQSEVTVAEALRTAAPTGLAIVGVLLPGERGVDIDILVVHAYGVMTVEVKGTAMSGEVGWSSGGDWTIGGLQADFAGGANPTKQARRQAQRLGERCRAAGVAAGYVHGLVVVVGNVWCPPGEISGGVWVTDLAHLAEALGLPRRGAALTRATIRGIVGLLGLGNRTPGEDALDAAGFPRDDGTLPPTFAGVPAPGASAPPGRWQHSAPSRSDRYARSPRARRRPPPRARASHREPWSRRPPPERRMRRGAGLFLALFAAVLFVVAVLTMAAELDNALTPSPSPTPPRRAPVHRPSPTQHT